MYWNAFAALTLMTSLSVFTLACTGRMPFKDVQAAVISESADRQPEQTATADRAMSPDEWYIRGIVLSESGDHYKAAQAFKEAIKGRFNFPEAHFHLGHAYWMQGERGYALRAMNQAVSLQPGYAEAYYRLGLLQKELGNNDAAFAAFSKAIEIKPDNADLQFHLGETYLELRMKKEAKLAFMNAVDLRPDFTEAHYQLGRIYVMFNDIDAAFNEYTILIGLDRKRAYDLFNLIYK